MDYFRCSFCHKAVYLNEVIPVDNKFFKCPLCGTVQEKDLIIHPYKYSVGDRGNWQAPHVKVNWRK